MKPHPQQLRLLAVKLHSEEGLSIREISRRLSVSVPTISEWLDKYKGEGVQGLSTRYHLSGRCVGFNNSIIDKALLYKRQHPQWGAPFILVKLEDDFPGQQLPSARWLQKIFQQKQVQIQRTRLPKGKVNWATKAFDRVQVDAKERLKTADGQACCYLNFTDEYTGSELDAFLFPLCSNQ